MQLTGPFRKQLRLALQSGYPQMSDLRMLLLESLNVRLEEITGTGDLNTVTFNLIEWAIARGRLTELVQAATAENPQNTELQQIAAHFSFATKSTHGEVERVLLEQVPFANVAQWLTSLGAIRHRVCRIEPQQGSIANYGSGFLVGRDLVLTNFHVRDKWATPANVVFRFDYEADSQGVAVNEGTAHRLAAENWEIAASGETDCDYAIVRLASIAADDSVPTGKRGFIRPVTAILRSGEPMLILQHPEAEPLKLSIGTIDDPQATPQRISYTANTKGGSSGSPCLNMSLETIGVHHVGAVNANRGVLWSAIEADLKSKNKLQLIGV